MPMKKLLIGSFIAITLIVSMFYLPTESFASRDNARPLEVRDATLVCKDNSGNTEKIICELKATFRNMVDDMITLLEAKIPTVKVEREDKHGKQPLTFDLDETELKPEREIELTFVQEIDSDGIEMNSQDFVIIRYNFTNALSPPVSTTITVR